MDEQPARNDALYELAFPAPQVTRPDGTGPVLIHALEGFADAGHAALAARIRLLIDDGRIATYTRLPAERILADALGRSRTTVVSAYGALREAGYLVSVRGSGSVAMLPRRGPGAVAEIDFAHAVPEPVPGLEAIIERVTGNVPDLLRRPGLDLVGDPLLRRRIADRYTDRGLPTTPAQIVVTLGGQPPQEQVNGKEKHSPSSWSPLR